MTEVERRDRMFEEEYEDIREGVRRVYEREKTRNFCTKERKGRDSRMSECKKRDMVTEGGNGKYSINI